MASEAAKKKIAGLLSGAPKGGDLPRGLLSKGSMSKYTPNIEQGGELDPLAIYKNGKEDGRHRAIAAKELGITKLPVLVWDK